MIDDVIEKAIEQGEDERAFAAAGVSTTTPDTDETRSTTHFINDSSQLQTSSGAALQSHSSLSDFKDGAAAANTESAFHADSTAKLAAGDHTSSDDDK